MERLTQVGYDMCAECPNSVCCEHYTDRSFPVCGNRAIYDRLAAYENTGLSPEEVAELRKRRHNMTGTRLYSIWRSMRQRCNSPKHKDYKHYGARGITICKEWDSFPAFSDWATANGYSDNLSIDRIDVNGNYCPENCRWADNSTQSKNRRCTQISFNGETHTIEEWSEIIGVSNSGIRYRIQQKLPIDQILSSEKKGGCCE